MPVIEHKGIKINVDDDGYLVNPKDWNENVARALAEIEGVGELTKDKMDIITFMREFFEKYQSFPMLGMVCKNIHQPQKCVTEQFIEPLKAWKIAGLSKPGPMVLGYIKGHSFIVKPG
jgi:dissimilatory sulfite reductase related protein